VNEPLPPDWDGYLAKIAAGTMTYEDTADLFMASFIGRATGVSRADLLSRLHQRFATHDELIVWLRGAYARWLGGRA
jgi:hypothetical protein